MPNIPRTRCWSAVFATRMKPTFSATACAKAAGPVAVRRLVAEAGPQPHPLARHPRWWSSDPVMACGLEWWSNTVVTPQRTDSMNVVVALTRTSSGSRSRSSAHHRLPRISSKSRVGACTGIPRA